MAVKTNSILEKKKDLLVEVMKLGMDFETACVVAELTGKEKEKVEQDEDFISRVNYSLAQKEVDLLEKLNKVAIANAERGETKQIERMLELLNPARYSKVTKLSHQVSNDTANGGKVTIEFQDVEDGKR